jgi:hypothetical protein
MLLRILIPAVTSGIALAVHIAFSVLDTAKTVRALDPDLDISYWGIYSSSLQNFIGFSIALGVLFFTYAVLKYIQMKETAAGSIITGVMISAILFLILSFSLGYYTVSIEDFYIKK